MWYGLQTMKLRFPILTQVSLLRSFYSHLQYSLLNWGKAASSHLQKLIILQNKFIRASLFCAKENRLTFFTLSLIRLCLLT